MLHIENLTVNVQSGQTALSKAFIDALLRGPAVDTAAEGEIPVPTAPIGKLPRIGEYWQGQGGVYAGMARGRDGEADFALIMCEESPEEEFTWQGALDHAKTITVDGHTDFSVPTRFESALLYANLQDLIDTNYWYWTSTQYSERRAWSQDFGSGNQINYYKGYERRVRFGRRLVL